jgi:flagellar motility protein MotE (MotC chaperone)
MTPAEIAKADEHLAFLNQESDKSRKEIVALRKRLAELEAYRSNVKDEYGSLYDRRGIAAKAIAAKTHRKPKPAPPPVVEAVEESPPPKKKGGKLAKVLKGIKSVFGLA